MRCQNQRNGGVLAIAGNDPSCKSSSLCSQSEPMLYHLEMETYTWEVLPGELKHRNVVDQLVAEYEWTLAALKERGL